MQLRQTKTVGERPTTVPEPTGTVVGGYTLLADRSALSRRGAGILRFKILDEDGRTVRGFDMLYGSRMHLVVVRRRDLAHYRHLYPPMSLDGTWSASLGFPEAGVYRAIADFSAGGAERTLGVDLAAPGSTEAKPVPAPVTTARVGGYAVDLETDSLAAGSPGRLRFRISRAGREVTGLEDHLGARAHLLILRAGDLLLLRGRPLPRAADGATLGFEVDLPGRGRYRLFLCFVHGGSIRTAAFTVEVAR